MQRNARIALSIGISGVFLFFALRGIEWSDALRALSNANYFYVLPILGTTVWQLYIRAQRWRVLLHHIGQPHMSTLVAATNIGWLANFVLPLRAGEVIRPVLLSQKEKLPLGAVLATIAVERIFDMFTILFLFGLTAALAPISETVRSWGFGLLGLAATVAAGIVFVRWQEKLALRLLDLVSSPLPTKIAEPLRHFFGGFVHALEVLDSPATIARLVVWSLFLWFINSCVFGLGLLMFGVDAPLLLGQILLTVVIAVAVSAPSAPGFIGAFQLGCTIGFDILGASEGDAVAYGLAVHAIQFVAIIGAGLFSLAQQGMSLHDVGEVSSNGTPSGR